MADRNSCRQRDIDDRRNNNREKNASGVASECEMKLRHSNKRGNESKDNKRVEKGVSVLMWGLNSFKLHKEACSFVTTAQTGSGEPRKSLPPYACFT